jgi:peptide/nickel transport system permease protein
MSEVPVQSEVESPVQPRVGRSLWGDAVLRIKRDPVALACLGVIVLYAVVAVVAPLVWSNWETNTNYELGKADPSWDHPLGTDQFGRDVLQKTLLGAHLSMSVALYCNILAVPVGILIGAVAGYYGRFLDDAIVWLYTTLASIPGIIRLIALKFAFQAVGEIKIPLLGSVDMRGMAGLVLALSITSWIGTCRLVRAETMRIRELDYVLASRAVGRRSFAILLRHVVPNVLHLGIIQFSLGFVQVIMAEVVLSYLNLGVPNKPSWGVMIADAQMDLVTGKWWELTAAVGAMFFIVLAWNIFGDRLRDALDPRLKNVG